MIYDLTAGVLERALKAILAPIDAVLVAEDGVSIPDDFDGYIVQARHTANTALTHDGSMPVIATYEVEIARRVFGDGVDARATDSGASMALNLSALQARVDEVIEAGLSLHIIHSALTAEAIETSESGAHIFTSTFEVTCQPLMIEEV